MTYFDRACKTALNSNDSVMKITSHDVGKSFDVLCLQVFANMVYQSHKLPNRLKSGSFVRV